jgi:hypothetical protein
MDQFQQLHSVFVQYFFYGCALYMMLSVAWWVEKQARKGGEQNESTGADHGHGRGVQVVGITSRLRKGTLPKTKNKSYTNR